MKRCASCGHDNRETARFCDACGAALARMCSRCGNEVGWRARFCVACGVPARDSAPFPGAVPDPRSYTPRHLAEQILRQRSALEGERKQVTVLFADLQGSVALSERLDPEVLHGIMDRFFTVLTDGVHRFEGTINQYTGDGIMALFGAPVAHEDHARRACFAALYLRDEIRHYSQELRRRQGLDFAVRIGLNSGEVVVGKIGDDLRMDYTAQGHTVGLAARVEQLAEAGKAYVTEHTANLASGFLRFEDLGLFNVKGVPAPLRVCELKGVGRLRTRLEVSRARGFSRFVGRKEEMEALEVALGRAASGSGQVVGIVGEAGVGKSRLCFEFAESCRARGLTVHEAHGVTPGKAIPFLPVLEYLRHYFGITDRDSGLAAREKIAGKLLLLDRSLTDHLPLLFDFLGVADPEHLAPVSEPEGRQRELLAAVTRLLHAQSHREPVISVIEDLHWIDGGTERFVAHLAEAAEGTRTVLLVNFRPGYRAEWMARSFYRELDLHPLDEAATRQLLDGLLGSDASLGSLADRIQARTAGNPFFVEEVVHELVETGKLDGERGAYRLKKPVGEFSIPVTLQAVLAARIDRLSERDKQLLQTAAVIGREFSDPVLRRVARMPEAELNRAVHALVAADFVYKKALQPDVEYAFKHPLTHEVAYHSQLGQRRARVHGVVARTMAQLDPDRLDERAALLAHHWEAAGDVREAALWHRRAAEWAGWRHPPEACRHWRSVRALLDMVPERPDTLALALGADVAVLRFGMRLGIAEAEAAAILRAGRRRAERLGDLRSLANLTSVYGSLRRAAGDVRGALAYSEEAARLASRVADPRLAVALGPDRVNAYIGGGRPREAIDSVDRLIALARTDSSMAATGTLLGPYVMLLLYRGFLLSFAGRLAEAAQQLEEVLTLAPRTGALETLCYVHTEHVRLAYLKGSNEGALEHARAAVELSDRTHSPHLEVYTSTFLGMAYSLDGQWDKARHALKRALEIVREHKTRRDLEAMILLLMSRAYLGAADSRRARNTARRALVVAKDHGPAFTQERARLNLAHVLLQTDGVRSEDAIVDALTTTLSHHRKRVGVMLEPFIRVERAELARLRGDESGRRRELKKAYRLFTDMGATGHAARIQPLLS